MEAMKYLLPCIAIWIAGCGGSGIERDTLTGDILSVPGMPPIPGEAAVLSLKIAPSGDVSGSCVSRGETGSCSGFARDGILNVSVDFPNHEDWLVRGDSRYYDVLVSKERIVGDVFVDSQEFTRTVHIYRGTVDLQR
jgi:hypothetical protein